MTTTRSYTVTGMTCDHCVRAVTEEVGTVEGVDRVVVDLDSGRLTVQAPDTVTDADIAAAVDEAGYEISG